MTEYWTRVTAEAMRGVRVWIPVEGEADLTS